MSDNYELILSRLQRVRRTSSTTAKASCPVSSAHRNGDKNPSLTISVKDDGVILVRCHSQQCGFGDIVSALGLAEHDFFPPRQYTYDYRPPQRKPFPADDVLACLGEDAMLVYIIGSTWLQGETPDKATMGVLLDAVTRILAAVELGCGNDALHEASTIREKARLREQEEKDIEDFVHA